MKSFSWIGTAISALVGAVVNPWLTAYGLTIILLIVVVHSIRDAKIADITTNPVVNPDNNSKKHNKKNR